MQLWKKQASIWRLKLEIFIIKTYLSGSFHFSPFFEVFDTIVRNRNIRKSMLLLLFCLDPVTKTTEKLAEPPDIASWNYIVSVIGPRLLSSLLSEQLSFNILVDTGYSVVLKVKTFQWKVIFLKEKKFFLNDDINCLVQFARIESD